MHIDELAAYFNISPQTIHKYSKRGVIPPPRGKNRWATYGPEHVAAIRQLRTHREYHHRTLADLAEDRTFWPQSA